MLVGTEELCHMVRHYLNRHNSGDAFCTVELCELCNSSRQNIICITFVKQ